MPRCANDKGGLEWGAHTVDWSGAAGGQEDAALRRSAPPAGDNSLQGDRAPKETFSLSFPRTTWESEKV